mgnify:CR=1 FL=1
MSHRWLNLTFLHWRYPVDVVQRLLPPGLEVDFRFVWRRVFTGLLLREYDNLVMAAEDPQHADLVMHRLLRVEYPSASDSSALEGFSTTTTQIGPNPYDTEK